MRDPKQAARQAEEERDRLERERIERLYEARENFRDANRKRREAKEESEKKRRERQRLELLQKRKQLREGRRKYVYMLIGSIVLITILYFLLELTDNLG